MQKVPKCQKCQEIFQQDSKPIRSFACIKNPCQYLICQKCFHQIQQCPGCQTKYQKEDNDYFVDDQLFNQMLLSQEQKLQNKLIRVSKQIDQKQEHYAVILKLFLIQYLHMIGIIGKPILDTISMFVDSHNKNKTSGMYIEINNAFDDHDKYLANPTIKLLFDQLTKIKFIQICLEQMKAKKNLIQKFQEDLNQINPVVDWAVAITSQIVYIGIKYRQQLSDLFNTEKLQFQQDGQDKILSIQEINQFDEVQLPLDTKELGSNAKQIQEGLSEITIENQKQLQQQLIIEVLDQKNSIMIYEGPSTTSCKSFQQQILTDQNTKINIDEGPSNIGNKSLSQQILNNQVDQRTQIMIYEGKNFQQQILTDQLEQNNKIMIYESPSEIPCQNEFQQQVLTDLPNQNIETQQQGLQTTGENLENQQLFNNNQEQNEKILPKEKQLKYLQNFQNIVILSVFFYQAYSYYQLRQQSKRAIEFLEDNNKKMQASLNLFREFVLELENLQK